MSPKLVSYNNEGVEESQGGTGVKVKPGVHIAKIARCTLRDAKKDGSAANDIEVALNVGDEFDWVFTYIGLSEGAKWKMAEFTRALGLKENGRFDPEKMIGKFIRVKINPDSYEGEYAPRAGRLMKAQPGDEDAFDEGNSGVSELSVHDDSEPEDDEPEDNATEDGDDDGFVPSREGEEGIDSYEDWPEEDLLAEVEDRNLTLKGGRGSKTAKAITALRDDDAEASGASEDDDESDDGDDDYDSWDIDQLKKEWEDRDMGDLPTIKGRNAEARLTKAIIEALREDDESNPFEA